MSLDLTQLDILEGYLKEEKIKYERTDNFSKIEMVGYSYEHHQIVVFDENDKAIWDAIISSGSYGHEVGLLEVMGRPVLRPEDDDSVCGHLTAVSIIQRYKNWLNKNKKI